MTRPITADNIRSLYHNEPFQPFDVLVRGGEVFAVPSRNRIVIAPSGNFIIVVGPGESLTQIGVARITEIRLRTTRARRSKRPVTRRRKAG